ncbi:MAG: glycoside hydrolase family 3 C-terminal domain-containing protein [Bacteroides sp.]|uniref:glycoside hydrolase family 3 C-terminal domain-containing protein n=1 Tax=Bacteroides sp. TaxID=29523 RepID=UPI001B7985D0|nr:glycoside hydrolase family 3 C-terminal domain-containing protein [Bacteroides sp.]MBP9585282.1 glycoside hydrolase family 3 C-terminal domain-containing protein [Bacteroides sp.]
MKLKSIALGLSLIALPALAQTPVYLDATQPIEERVEDALSRMTVKEKVAMTHAQSKFSSAGVPRLGIPENWMSDGPHGIRAEVLWDEWYGANWTNDSCIAFPALTALAATWNTDMSALYGKSIGEEARYRNKNVLLGPGVNIYRTPLNGRNFEYMGEDPYLASIMVVPYIREVQKNGVAACVKHYALNNQEIHRGHINVKVDDRALYEIYLPAFKAAVQEGGAWAIMGAYNQYKEEFCCHNQYLLNDILKRDWGFDGVVVSDWGGVHDTKQSIYNGLDMEFGTWTNGLNWSASNAYDNYYLAVPYLKLLEEGKVSTRELDDKVRRILRLVFRTNMAPERHFGSFGTEAHALAGRQIAEEGMVLLQNNRNLLPIDARQTKRILVVGENAVKRMTIGGGSSSLKVKYEVSPLEGIRARVGSAAEVVYAAGYASPAVAEQDVKGATARQETIDPLALRREAVEAARGADVVLFVGGLNKNDGQDCEGNDRASLALPYEQDALIAELVAANPNTVVVIISGNAVAMPWANKVPAIVEAWYSGTEAGSALASVLFGDVNPSGKLPFTFPARLEDNSAHALGEYPGDSINVSYNESIFVGYRWADKQTKIRPLFPFGHGLSYTTFAYGKPTANKKALTADETITFTVQVKNTGTREGQEVVQLYISDKKSSLPRPVKELKGFSKVRLAPGEEKTITFTIGKEALSFFDDSKHAWVAEPGKFEALIGASSADLKGAVSFELK